MTKKILMLACLFALVMPLVACGGGDAGDDAAPPAESPTESPS